MQKWEYCFIKIGTKPKGDGTSKSVVVSVGEGVYFLPKNYKKGFTVTKFPQDDSIAFAQIVTWLKSQGWEVDESQTVHYISKSEGEVHKIYFKRPIE